MCLVSLSHFTDPAQQPSRDIAVPILQMRKPRPRPQLWVLQGAYPTQQNPDPQPHTPGRMRPNLLGLLGARTSAGTEKRSWLGTGWSRPELCQSSGGTYAFQGWNSCMLFFTQTEYSARSSLEHQSSPFTMLRQPQRYGLSFVLPHTAAVF